MLEDVLFDVKLKSGEVIYDCTFKELRKRHYMFGHFVSSVPSGEFKVYDIDENEIQNIDLDDAEVIKAYDYMKDKEVTDFYQIILGKSKPYKFDRICNGSILLDD